MKVFQFCMLAILPVLLASSAFGRDEGITPELRGSSKIHGLNAETKTGNDELFDGFRNPPPAARPYVFWIWVSGNITRSGITADLEAMASAGIGGASIFNTGGSHGVDIPPGPVEYMSAQWLDLFNFAASEAQRLGLTLGMENCAGWATMGGPWIKPEHGSQRLVSTALNIEGGKPIVRQLARPETKLDYYRDIAILAYPTPKNETYQLPTWKSKAAQDGWRLGQQPDLTDRPVDAAIPVHGIVDLTRKVDAEGKLTWDAPDGNWTILRLGHTPMGTQNFPALEAGRGLEVDKLNRAAVDAHWQNGIQPVIDRLGNLSGPALRYILVDSYEGGTNHWTAAMHREFAKRRGYDLSLYLPALTGRLVEDGPTTERFLWDFRRTVSELYAECFYGHVADLCHKNGLEFHTEPYYGPFEFMAVGAKADLALGEFWVGGDNDSDLKIPSSISHINGRNLAGAEAFTAMPYAGKWQYHPGKLRALGDSAFTQGINRLVLHAYAHQPFDDSIVPGMTFGQWGTHFDRNITWFKPGKAWFSYMARSQFLLQYGDFAADVLFFAGEASPNGGVNGGDIKNAGFDYDVCGTDIFAKLEARDGNIVVPCGRRYRLLVMPPTPFQSPQVIRKVRGLVAAGATVLSTRPQHSPTLAGFPESQDLVLSLASQLWGECNGTTIQSNRHGKGRIFDGLSPANVLRELGIQPAVQLPKAVSWIHRRSQDTDIFFLANSSNQTVRAIAGFRATGRKPEFFDAESGAVTDAAGWTVDGDYVRVPLKLEPEKSVFIVFRHLAQPPSDPYVSGAGPDGEPLDFDGSVAPRFPASRDGTHTLRRASGKISTVEVVGVPQPVNLTGPWEVRFQEKRGAPEKASFDKLASWTENENPGIRYFSGTAKYSIRFDLSHDPTAKDVRAWLDLGEVGVMAEVRVNGVDRGVVWQRPFIVEVGKDLRSGANTIEINVTNLWINRLIGDEQHPPDSDYHEKNMDWYVNRGLKSWPEWMVNGTPRPSAERVTFTTWKHWNKQDALQPSGLIGPVTIRFAKAVPPPPTPISPPSGPIQ